ncbi:DUF3795 domain-containing protein [Methanococcoides alaskense]|uniref:DUF3795 domain-containing protein n=1 Tax=Methanococcoides alaskense TaxID=325778 RepID=A0AA90TX58_9EURY|nr:DUF3795 domain-containing protein [Methanococcoides alaskense]MDA0525369.1 DUF3795 domain-containing protein [Methanococcoides alaskense]MDR6221700.1 hypothetical protein [Methanococcoides alaskense]
MDIKELTSPCGMGCFACGVYKDNITDEMAQSLAGMLGIEAKDVVPCDGCRSERGSIFLGTTGCPTKTCVESKGLHNCSECSEFPCENQMPVADQANIFPHNTKLYNLSRIKLNGLEAWAAEAGMIQQKYFKGKFAPGKGPYEGEDTIQSE